MRSSYQFRFPTSTGASINLQTQSQLLTSRFPSGRPTVTPESFLQQSSPQLRRTTTYSRLDSNANPGPANSRPSSLEAPRGDPSSTGSSVPGTSTAGPSTLPSSLQSNNRPRENDPSDPQQGSGKAKRKGMKRKEKKRKGGGKRKGKGKGKERENIDG